MATPDVMAVQDLLLLGRRVSQVLPKAVHQDIFAAWQCAQSQGHQLNILFETTPETIGLLAVPWELMVLPLVDQCSDAFLLRDARVNLVRQVRGWGSEKIPQLQLPLGVQVFAAMPETGQTLESIAIRQAFEQVLASDRAEDWLYEGPNTLGVLQERLLTRAPQILYLFCHGEESITSRGHRHDLIFTHQDGFIQRVSAFELAPVLSLLPDLQVVVLMACHSGTIPSAIRPEFYNERVEGERRTVENIALALIRQGIPSVVTMQGRITQAAVETFIQVFHAELARGNGLGKAITASRIAMYNVSGAIDWSLPMVYQGSSLPLELEVATWYTHLADHVEAWMREPVAVRTLRGMLIAWGFLLLSIGLIRLLINPANIRLDHDALHAPLTAWFGVGLLGPGIIALAQRSVRTRPDLAPNIRHAALYAQWVGAYLGYALGSLLGLFFWSSLWSLDVFTFLPTALAHGLFMAVILVSLGFSYISSRVQWRSALVNTKSRFNIYKDGI
ncbi:CHAT domain-containing protein [Candidatus Chloroploca asiatica]|uniref:CHAT domain-containing protein n=1 Tax=Candidatus Chloroploca asiatica TaxID=1506545 RepID=A0A2H3KH08_9CHLR|nr:CHAT domain-containing protein [Candidatus Chloroploca asiatica]PDV97045.1 hypothetical protein A9Q02_19580 [Candidatus Chloroploca asiatica]